MSAADTYLSLFLIHFLFLRVVRVWVCGCVRAGGGGGGGIRLPKDDYGKHVCVCVFVCVCVCVYVCV